MPLMEKTNTALAIEGLKAQIEVSVEGGDFTRLRGADTVGYDAGERESESIPTFDGTVSILGAESINPVVINVPAWLPHLPVWTSLRRAKRDNADIQMRIRTAVKGSAGRVVATKAGPGGGGSMDRTAAMAAAGSSRVTFSPASDETRADLDALFTSNIVKVGHLLRLKDPAGQRDRVITSIMVDDDLEDGTANRFTLDALPAPAAAIAAVEFEIRFPQLQLLFACGVQKIGSVNLGAGSGGALGTELTVLPNDALDLPALRSGADIP